MNLRSEPLKVTFTLSPDSVLSLYDLNSNGFIESITKEAHPSPGSEGYAI